MEHAISRAVVQRLCDERAELVPYLTWVIDSMERNGGLYHAKLAEMMPEVVVEEIEEWLRGHLANTKGAQGEGPEGIAADLKLLEQMFPEHRK